MNERNNMIAGWVLAAGIVALGGAIVTGGYFEAERPEKMGYVVEGVEEEGAGPVEAAKPVEFYLATADAARGEQAFKKCTACHTIDQGGANGIGPNLWAIMGKGHGQVAGFTYSDALKAVPGVWDWKAMDAWIANPKKYAPGTKMSFAGISKPQERADLFLFLNSKSGAPLPIPAAPMETAAPAADAATGNATAPADNATAADAATGNATAPAAPTNATAG
jgi:cytochrome c